MTKKSPQAEPGFQDAVRLLIRHIGDDPDREGLRETPDRMMRSFCELFSGYSTDPETLLKTFGDGACDEMVVLRGTPLTSFCEHHWLPFSGVAHVAYLPRKKVVGVSKLARLVDCFSRRLQIQERMTSQIADALMTHLLPFGVGVVVEAEHLCMGCRGVKKTGSVMVTSALRGPFKTDPATRAEFLQFVRS